MAKRKCLDGRPTCNLERWTPEDCLGCILANIEDGIYYAIGQLIHEKVTFGRALEIRAGLQQVREGLDISALFLKQQYPEWYEHRLEISTEKRKMMEQQLKKLLNGKNLPYRT